MPFGTICPLLARECRLPSRWIPGQALRSLGCFYWSLIAGRWLTGALRGLLDFIPWLRLNPMPPGQETRLEFASLAGVELEDVCPPFCIPGSLIGIGAGLVIPFLNLYFLDVL